LLGLLLAHISRTACLQGTGALIKGTWYSLPLWKTGDRTDSVTNGGDIQGNLLIDGELLI
jgi:hypothetical protein